MRRLVAGALLLALAAGGAPAAAAKPRTVPGLLGVLVHGTAVLDVTVPRGVSLVGVAPDPVRGIAPGLAGVAVPGQWTAVAIVSRSTKVAGKPVMLTHVHLPQPDHCPSETAPTATPVPPCKKLVEHTAVHGITPTVSGGLVRYPLPAGTYQVVVGTEPGKIGLVALRFEGARGFWVATPPRRAATTLQRTRAANLAVAHATGSFTHKLSGKGVGVLGVWHTTAAPEPGEFTYAQCVTAGSAGPLNPDDCTPAGIAGAAPPEPVGREPVFWQASTGGVTLDHSGNGTFFTGVLGSGTYVNSYRVTRGGRGPAAGAFVWWFTSDAFK